MRIKIYSLASYYTAQQWSSTLTSAFNESSEVSQNSWDSGYQINMTNVDESKARAISRILNNKSYNELKNNNGEYNIKVYSFKDYSTAMDWANTYETAFGLYAPVSQNPWDSGYQININVYNQNDANAIRKVLSDKLYNELSEDSSGGGKTIPLPSNRRCNWNQFCPEITSAINSEAGCSITCGLDIANIYGPYSYTMNDLKFDWHSDGYYWNLPASCYGSINSDSYGSGYSDNQRFTAIKSEINSGRPVIVRLYKNGSTIQHFVVAYGYKNEGNSTSDIKVFDPAQDKYSHHLIYGRDTTLSEAITFNKKSGIKSLKLTHRK